MSKIRTKWGQNLRWQCNLLIKNDMFLKPERIGHIEWKVDTFPVVSQV